MASADLDNAGVKAIITLGVLAFVAVFAFIIAKIVQYCVNKHYTDDDSNDIDENTRDLIRARLSVVQYKKREIRKAQRTRAFNFFTRWKELVRNRKKDREKALKSQRPQGNGQVVVNMEKEKDFIVTENGITEKGVNEIKENGTNRIPRFPSFAQTRFVGGGIKAHSESPRNMSIIKTNSVKPEPPVPRGRPVSSKKRGLPNVTLTDVDINSSAKVLVKSVHFQDDENGDAKIQPGSAGIKTDSNAEKENKLIDKNKIGASVKSDKDKEMKRTVTVDEITKSEVSIKSTAGGNEKGSVSLKTKTSSEKTGIVNSFVKNSVHSTKDSKIEDGAKTYEVKNHNLNGAGIEETKNTVNITTEKDIENKDGEKT